MLENFKSDLENTYLSKHKGNSYEESPANNQFGKGKLRKIENIYQILIIIEFFFTQSINSAFKSRQLCSHTNVASFEFRPAK